MDFLKRHYEKILLGVMLAGLIGVLVFMLFYIASDKAAMEQKTTSIISRHVQPLSNLDLTLEDAAIARTKTSYKLDFETKNKLLNPVDWVRLADGTLVPRETKTGPQMCVVTNITPLFMIVSNAMSVTNELGARYNITVEHQGAATPAKRRPASHFVSPGEKPNEAFSLLEVQGPPDNPTGLVLKLADTSEPVTISKEKPYLRVEAYFADIWYAPEKKPFHNVRKGSHLPIGGVDYVVADVGQNEVILEDQSNQKKTTLPFKP